MKNILSKLLAVTLCALMVAAPLTGMAEEVTISGIIQAGSGILPPEDNFVIKTLEEKLGFNLDIIVCSNSDELANRKATLTAARNMPDIYTVSRADLADLVANEQVLPLDDLLAQYGPNLLEDKEGYWAGYTFDGKIYGIPSSNQEGQQPTLLAVRKDWLDNLGMAVPTTLDEFYEVMKAFTENDPDGNGENDTRGLAFWMGNAQVRYVFPEVFGMSSRFYNLVDGKVVPTLLHPNYIEMIRFYQKLYQGGYMEPDFATIPDMVALEKFWTDGYGALVFGPIGTTNNWASRYTNPEAEFVYVNLTGPDGIFHGYDLPRADLGNCVVVNANCKNPEAAIKLLDYLVTEEGQDLIILGEEGKHFVNNEDGSATYLSPYAEDITLQRNEGGYCYTAIIGSMKNCATIKTLNQVTRDAIAMGYEHPFTDSVALYQTPEIELEVGGLLSDITNEAFASLVVFEGDLEAEVQKYVDKWLKSGGAEWIEQATEIYNNQAK